MDSNKVPFYKADISTAIFESWKELDGEYCLFISDINHKIQRRCNKL